MFGIPVTDTAAGVSRPICFSSACEITEEIAIMFSTRGNLYKLVMRCTHLTKENKHAWPDKVTREGNLDRLMVGCLLEFYFLVTYTVISGWIPSCDSMATL